MIEREVVLQDAFQRFEATGNKKNLEKIQELAATEFEKSWLQPLKEQLKRRLSGQDGKVPETQVALRRLLTQLGINMDVPGKAVFYNDLTGIIMVRATAEDLAIVQAAIETLGGSTGESAASPGSARDGATPFSYNEDMMRRYGLLPPKK